jgi:DNA-binding beta-propeller fold protein YncE
MYSIQGHVVTEFVDRDGMDGPSGVTVCPDEKHIIVSECHGCRLKVFDIVTGACVRVIRTRPELLQPRGLAFLPNGNLVVCDHTTIRVFAFQRIAAQSTEAAQSGVSSDAEGSESAEQEEADHMNREIEPLRENDSSSSVLNSRVVHVGSLGGFNCVAGVAVLPCGHRIAVTECDHHRILVVNWKPMRVESQYCSGTAGSSTEQLDHPRCLCVLPLLG